ncbi:hypothetical protein Clacol_009462 [Clathrus columnatus]|uniref:NADP-dependent oxidoreductase domain-containing protein n=1 Tax=Clathrus columnatus TaxID=1419009 RepID=A0AAV5AS65_9AGAM|nr:hypothetical protein Clacol_009462 [Clathrus columnatus]
MARTEEPFLRFCTSHLIHIPPYLTYLTTHYTMSIEKYLILNTGAKMPVLGLGTWRSTFSEGSRAIEVAIKAGYRHIDTATVFTNEREVGDGIQTTGISREDIFSTTKLPNDMHDDPWTALQGLMHWPAPMNPGFEGPNKSIDWLDTWKKMEEIYLKAIGVLNVYGRNLKGLFEHATVTPAINQIKMHPGVGSSAVVTETLKHGTKITGYSPLGSEGSQLHNNPLVIELAEKYNVTPANILVSLQANKPGVSVLVKSVNESRIISWFT